MSEPETNDQQAPEPVDDETGAQLSLWRRLRLFGLLRIALMLLGVATLIVGGINAWRAEESLALLVVGLVFVLVGLVLAPDWSSIELAWGNVNAKLLRDISGRIEEVERADDPAVLRRELEELRAELDASSKRLARRTPRPAPAPVSDDFFRRIFSPPTKVTHSFRRDGAVELRLEWNSGGDEGVTCTIKPPEDNSIVATVEAAPRPPGFTISRTFTIVYPDEVPGSAQPVPGLYEVRWDRVRGPAADPTIEALMPLVTPPIATDSFTLR